VRARKSNGIKIKLYKILTAIWKKRLGYLRAAKTFNVPCQMFRLPRNLVLLRWNQKRFCKNNWKVHYCVRNGLTVGLQEQRRMNMCLNFIVITGLFLVTSFYFLNIHIYIFLISCYGTLELCIRTCDEHKNYCLSQFTPTSGIVCKVFQIFQPFPRGSCLLFVRWMSVCIVCFQHNTLILFVTLSKQKKKQTPWL
jgi:hypothetical protein